MKKLNKLTIHSEKLMKNEELVTLRGGYGGGDGHGLYCSRPYQQGGPCSLSVGMCDVGPMICSMYCPGYTSYTCN